MARYISEDEFIAWVKKHWCADCQNDNGLRCRVCWIDDAIDIVEEAPEADVVPKSEVVDIIKEVDSMIELVSAMVGLDIIAFGKYAQLKKKYTGGENNIEKS